MTTAVIALMAAIAALAVVALFGVAAWRARRTSEERITRALLDMGGRMDTVARELSGALQRVQEDSRRARALGELGGSIDLEEVLARTAEAANSLPGVDASVVHAAGADGTKMIAALGVPSDGAEQPAITGPPDGAKVRAVALSYHYPSNAEPADAIRSGIAIPLETDGEDVGYIAVYSRGDDAPLDARTFGDLEVIAELAGPAIDNARRFREAKQLADQDALTGLQNRRTFHETLAREVSRAQRYDRRLAVCVIDLDDFKSVNDRIGHLSGDSVLAEVADRIRDAVRTADIACRIGGDEFAVILPESTRTDAEGLFARIQAMLQRRPPVQAPHLNVSGGIAELRADDDAVSLFERADAALYSAKGAGKGTAA